MICACSQSRGRWGNARGAVPVQDIKVSCWHQAGIGAALLVVGGKGWGSPWNVIEGPWGQQRLVGQREQHQRWGRRPPIPTALSHSPCLRVPCLTAFPCPVFQLCCFPGKSSCWQTGWLSAGLAPSKDWMSLWVKAGPGSSLLGAAAHPRVSGSPGHHSCPG